MTTEAKEPKKSIVVSMVEEKLPNIDSFILDRINSDSQSIETTQVLMTPRTLKRRNSNLKIGMIYFFLFFYFTILIFVFLRRKKGKFYGF